MTSQKSKSPTLNEKDMEVRWFILQHEFDPFGRKMTPETAIYYLKDPGQYQLDVDYQLRAKNLNYFNNGTPLTNDELYKFASLGSNPHKETYKQRVREFFIDHRGQDPFGHTMSYDTVDLYLQDKEKWGREIKELEKLAQQDSKKVLQQMKTFPKASTTPLHVEDPALKDQYITTFHKKYPGTTLEEIEFVYATKGLDGLKTLEKEIKAYENAIKRSLGSSSTSKRWGGHRRATKGQSRKRALRNRRSKKHNKLAR
jgi:hypothetical protein